MYVTFKMGLPGFFFFKAHVLKQSKYGKSSPRGLRKFLRSILAARPRPPGKVLNKKLTRVHLSFSHSVKERAAEEGTGVEFVVR